MVSHPALSDPARDTLFGWVRLVLRPGDSVRFVGLVDESATELAWSCVGAKGYVEQLPKTDKSISSLDAESVIEKFRIVGTPAQGLPAANANRENVDLLWFTNHDYDLLEGSIGLIAKQRPALIVPWVAVSDLIALSKYSKNLGYSSYLLQSSTDNSDIKFAVLLPDERLERYRCYGDGTEPNLKKIDEEGNEASSSVDFFIPDRRTTARGPYIAVSFYRNSHLASFIAEGLLRISEELKYFDCTVLLYNDSPDDLDLRSSLDTADKLLSVVCDCSLFTNSSNLGFVSTMNAALRLAGTDGRDIILLNSDACLAPGALGEILRVASLDPMIGFVSPRSNNATIATAGQFITTDVNDTRGNAVMERDISATLRYLPRFQFVPTVVGFCLFIKSTVIRNFGVFDTQYGKGYNEENDLVMRAGRCGFRAALANWAYALHIGEQSFALEGTPRDVREIQNRKILDSRYPEYSSLIDAYFRSSAFSSENFLTTLRESRISILIDGTAIYPWHNGTISLAVSLIRAIVDIAKDNLDISLVCRADAADFHKLGDIGRLKILQPWPSGTYEIALRIGQPFDVESVQKLSELAPVNVFFMLDTIALDCVQLYKTELEHIWSCVTSTADGLIYNSNFTQQQFSRRFRIDRSSVRELVSYHSLKRSDYQTARDSTAESTSGHHILLVGNHFPHKNLAKTYRSLVEMVPQNSYVVLGISAGELLLPGRADRFYEAGDLSQELIDSLYSNARMVIFPSLYEGFGFPIQHALAHHRPVYAPQTEINLEILSLISSRNLRLYIDIDDLVTKVVIAEPWLPEDNAPVKQQHDWFDSAREILNLCLICLNRTRIEKVIQRRQKVHYMVFNSQVDRLAQLSGGQNLNTLRRIWETAKTYLRVVGVVRRQAKNR